MADARLVDALGQQVGQAAVNVLSLQIQLADMAAQRDHALQHAEMVSAKLADMQSTYDAIVVERDDWRSKAEGKPHVTPGRRGQPPKAGKLPGTPPPSGDD